MTNLSLSGSTSWPTNAQHPLYTNRWFSSLSKPQQETLLAAGRRMLLSDGQLFATQGEPVRKRRDGFAVLIDGLIKVSSTSNDGREAILNFIRPGQWFGELAVLDEGSRERDFFSVGSSDVLVIEADAMYTLLQDAQLASQIARLLAMRTRALLSLAEGFTLRSSLARTARRLVMLAYDDEAETGQHRSSLDVSQDALASMLGMTRQSVASQLRLLAERGAIEQAYGRIKIASMSALLEQST
ncbi:MAG: Crp/Fnr family transcriptional regulator [Burkholderiales bacterium]|nr:MAG: Crp/Fnr family transcriptional regulator [Burkholderiales bacterium]